MTSEEALQNSAPIDLPNSIESHIDSVSENESGNSIKSAEFAKEFTGSFDPFSLIPQALKERPQWLMWRRVQRGKKSTKVPYRPNGSLAKSNDHSTWSDFATCSQAVSKQSFDGIGFAFCKGDGLTGIDLDHCYGADRLLEPWAQEIVDHFPTAYIEKSPSGDGLHIWCFGKALKTGRKRANSKATGSEAGVEVYDYTSPRYLTVTGLAERCNEVSDCQSGLDWLYQAYFAEHHQEPSCLRNADGHIDIETVRAALQYIPADDYQIWIEIGMALKTSGLDLFIWEEWSQRSSKFAAGECSRKWLTFQADRLSLGTVFYIAKQHGYTSSSQTSSAAMPPDWTDPNSFGEPMLFGEITTPEITSEFLPTWVKNFVEALAEHTQTPVDMSAMLVLSTLASCVQKRFEIAPFGTDYSEPLSLWTVVTMPPASRKSAVLHALTEPIREWEREEAFRLKPEISRLTTEREILLRKIEELKKRASRVEE